MAEITIDGHKHDPETMTPEQRTMVGNLQFVDGEIARKQNQLAVLQTARIADAQPRPPAGHITTDTK